MTEQEKFNAEVQAKLTVQDEKFNMLINELKEQREDIRRLQDRQDAELREIRQRQDAAQARHDAEMHEMNQRFYEKFDDVNKKIDDNFKMLSNQMHSNFIQTLVGFGAIAAAVGGLVFAAFK